MFKVYLSLSRFPKGQGTSSRHQARPVFIGDARFARVAPLGNA